MPKSKYPSSLDTSVEIPAVRDNVVEIGSDVLNSLRSALFQIEKTLGINPQGAVGNTVAERIGKVIDGNGNILKDALDRANLLSGPIINADVSKTAGIDESKLKLNFPTTLLQDEISQVQNQFHNIELEIEELIYKISAHINPLSVGRHFGDAITIKQITDVASSVGITSLEETSLQNALSAIFASHFNYDSSNISSTNRSHLASQIYYDNANTSDTIGSNDVQGAIDDMNANLLSGSDIHQFKHHDNGRLNISKIFDPSNINYGLTLLNDSAVSYFNTTSYDTTNISSVFFDIPQVYSGLKIQKSDILVITDSDGVREFQIADISTNIDNEISSVYVYGSFDANSLSGTTAKICKNLNSEANPSGLLATAREYKSLSSLSYTNSDIIQIANPASTVIVTKNIKPSAITIVDRDIGISIDGAATVTLDLYSSSSIYQTIDTVLKRINEQVSSNALSVSAYRVDYTDGRQSEIAFAHNIPNTQTSTHSIKFEKIGSDSAIDYAGLSDYIGIEHTSGTGSLFNVYGKDLNSLGVKLSESGLILVAGTSQITSVSLSFASIGIKSGDLISIYGSASDDGTYVITSVTDEYITVSPNQLLGSAWSGESTDNTYFYIFKNSVSLKNLEFDVVSTGPSAAVVDVFMDSSGSIFYNKRIEYGQVTYGASGNLISIVDFSGDISEYLAGSEGELKASFSASGEPQLSLDSGESVIISQIKQSYKLNNYIP